MVSAPSGSTRWKVGDGASAAEAKRRAVYAIAIGVGYCAMVYLSSSLRYEPYRVAVVWPAAGVLLAALMATRIQRWPEIALATYVAFCLAAVPRLGYTLVTAALFQAVMVAQIALAVLTVRVAALRSNRRQIDPWMLLLLALMVSILAFPGGTLRNWLIRSYLGQSFAGADTGRAIVFAMAVVLGALSLGPLLLTILDRDWRKLVWQRAAALEGVGLALLAAGAGLMPPVYLPVVQSQSPVTLALPVIVLVLASLRLGLGGASACLVAYALTMAARTSVGAVPFAGASAEANVVGLQLWLIALALPTLAVAAVVDERRRAMRALEESEGRARELAGRLINAQETERTRIGRELHDNVGQLLSSLAIGLSRLKQRAGPDRASEAAVLQNRAVAISDEVRRLSHELHSGVLTHAGLPEAVRALADEVAVLGPKVTIVVTDPYEPLPSAIELCLFRVAQEALHNAVTHASMRRLDVALRVDRVQATLSVTDDGCGFVGDEAADGPGIGIASMRERVRLAGGYLSVQSRPGKGTTIRATVPLPLPGERARA